MERFNSLCMSSSENFKTIITYVFFNKILNVFKRMFNAFSKVSCSWRRQFPNTCDKSLFLYHRNIKYSQYFTYFLYLSKNKTEKSFCSIAGGIATKLFQKRRRTTTTVISSIVNRPLLRDITLYFAEESNTPPS